MMSLPSPKRGYGCIFPAVVMFHPKLDDDPQLIRPFSWGCVAYQAALYLGAGDKCPMVMQCVISRLKMMKGFTYSAIPTELV